MADLENENGYTWQDAERFRNYLANANNNLAKRDETICELTTENNKLKEKNERILFLLDQMNKVCDSYKKEIEELESDMIDMRSRINQ
jgi:peptidoglycan hydrolase CwlO-like protein